MRARDHLARWLSEMLGRYFARMARAPLDPDDLQQKACMAVLDNLNVFEDRGPGSFGRWAREVGRRRMLRERAAQQREAARRVAFARHPRESTLSHDSRITLGELQQQLTVALGGLTEIQREAVLCEFEGREDAQLAESRHMTVRALRMHRLRGRASLARQTQKMRKTPLPRLPPRKELGSTPEKI